MITSSSSQAPAAPRRSVFLVDDHPLVREGLKLLIEREGDLYFCGYGDEPDAAYAGIVRLQPDIVVADLSLGGGAGLQLIRRLQEVPRPPRVLVLSMHDETHFVERALLAGALGYVMKRESSGKVIEAIRSVLQGKLYVSQTTASRISGKLGKGSRYPVGEFAAKLSNRELEIFRRMGLGQETRSIATDLQISLKTVQTHCMHIKEKLGIDHATMLMREAVRWVESTEGGRRISELND